MNMVIGYDDLISDNWLLSKFNLDMIQKKKTINDSFNLINIYELFSLYDAPIIF